MSVTLKQMFNSYANSLAKHERKVDKKLENVPEPREGNIQFKMLCALQDCQWEI